MAAVAEAHFSIDGEWLTEIVRSLVAEGRWRHALATLVDGLHGISTDEALSVLRGEYKLVGVNECALVAEDAEVTAAHVALLAWQYAGLWRKRPGELLQPYAVVTNYGRCDLPRSDWPKSENARALFYADDAQRDTVKILDRQAVLWRRVDDPPLWLRGLDTAEQAMADFKARGRHLDERGAHQYDRPDELPSIYENDPEEPDTARVRTTAARLGLPAAFQPAVDAIFGPEEPDRRPEPDLALSAESGYILPDGSFYGCAYMKHRDLADRLLRHVFKATFADAQLEADRRNWLRIQKSLTATDPWLILSPKGKPTKRQERTLMDWCAKHGAPYPQELLP